mgnify:CR=1 FL=1
MLRGTFDGDPCDNGARKPVLAPKDVPSPIQELRLSKVYDTFASEEEVEGRSTAAYMRDPATHLDMKAAPHSREDIEPDRIVGDAGAGVHGHHRPEGQSATTEQDSPEAAHVHVAVATK